MKENTKPKAYQLCDELHEMNKSCLLTKEQHDTIFASSLALERLHLFELAFEDYLSHSQWIQDTAHVSELGMHRIDVAKKRIEDLTKELEEVKNELAKSQAEGDRWRRRYEAAERVTGGMISF